MEVANLANEVKSVIVNIVRECTCDVCGYVSSIAIRDYPMSVECVECTNKLAKQLTEDECVRVWVDCCKLSSDLDTSLSKMIKAAPEMCSLPHIAKAEMMVALMYMVLRVNRSTNATIEQKCELYKMVKKLPEITYLEWMRMSYFMKTDGLIWLNARTAKIVEVNDARLRSNKLVDIWILESHIFESYIQWFPREILEDVDSMSAVHFD